MAFFDGTFEPEDNGLRQPMRRPRQASNMGLMIFLGVCLIVVTVATMRWVDHTGAPQASQVETIPLTPPDEAYAATPPAPVETEDPEAVARGRQLAMQPAVRQQMCTNYATLKGTCPTCGSRIPKLKITSLGLRRLEELRKRANTRKAI